MRRLPRALRLCLLAGLGLAGGAAAEPPRPAAADAAQRIGRAESGAPHAGLDRELAPDPLRPGALWEPRWQDARALLHPWLADEPAAEGALRAELTRRHGPAGEAIADAWTRASRVLPLLGVAVYPGPAFPSDRGGPGRHSLGPSLGEYAQNAGTAPALFESLAEASRRILAGQPPTRHPPEAVSEWLAGASMAILAAAEKAERAAGGQRSPEFEALVTDLRAIAHLAQFHSRRIVGAVHYNLFRRSLRLAELVAATLVEQQAVAAWRQLEALARERHPVERARGARPSDLSAGWAAELKLLEAGLKELEEQCCPPDEAVLKERVWSPAAAGRPGSAALTVTIAPALPTAGARLIVTAAPPLRLRAARLHYRPAHAEGAYRPLPLSPDDAGSAFGASLPADFGTTPTLYFVEGLDTEGKPLLWPDLRTGRAFRFAGLPPPDADDGLAQDRPHGQIPPAATLKER